MRAERRLQRFLCNLQEDQSGQSDCLPNRPPCEEAERVANERQIKEIATQHEIKGKKHHVARLFCFLKINVFFYFFF